ncbi:hypothetical protein AKO1_003649, partial [Acrasis kona]
MDSIDDVNTTIPPTSTPIPAAAANVAAIEGYITRAHSAEDSIQPQTDAAALQCPTCKTTTVIGELYNYCLCPQHLCKNCTAPFDRESRQNIFCSTTCNTSFLDMTNYNLRLTTYREICATEKDGLLSNFPLLSHNDSYRLQNQYLLQRSLVILDFHEHARKTRADVLYTPNLGGLSFFYLNEHGIRCVLRGTGSAHHCVSSDVLTPYESECFDFVEEHFAPSRIHCRTLQKYISHDHQGSVNYIAVQKDTPTHFMTYAGASCNHLNELKICTVDPIYNRQSLFFQHAQKLDPSRVIYG